MNDSASYIDNITSTRLEKRRKRNKKEELKVIKCRIEAQMMNSQTNSPDIFVPFPPNFEMEKNDYSRSYSKPNAGCMSKTTTIKVANNPVTVKPQKVETSRSVEESEKISTAVSSYDRNQARNEGTKYVNDHELVHNEYNKSSEESPKPVVEEEPKRTEEIQDNYYNEESLLDQIYAKEEEQYSDGFLKDSIPHI